LALTPDVPDNPAQKDLQLPGLLSGALELTGVSVTGLFDECLFAGTLIALAQSDLSVFGRLHQGLGAYSRISRT
jgi:hypothetical protein